MKIIINEKTIDPNLLNYQEIFSFNPNCELFSDIIHIGFVNGEYLRDSLIDPGFAEGSNWVVDDYIPYGYVYIEVNKKEYNNDNNLALKKLITHEVSEALGKLFIGMIKKIGITENNEYYLPHFISQILESLVRFLFKENFGDNND